MKKLKLLAFFAIVSVVLSTGCKQDDYVATVGVCPLVASTNPENAALDVPVNQVITATFNEDMNPATITQSSFTIQQGETVTAGLKAAMLPISGTVSYTDSTASFTPSGELIPNTTYTATIKSSVKDLMGNALQEDFVWTFKTGTFPVVTTSIPANNATGIALDASLTATFSMSMDPLSINGTSFALKHGTIPVDGNVSFTGSTATFNPTSEMLPNTLYTATLTTGAENVGGAALASNYEWSFTTVSINAPTVVSTNPLNNATGITLDKTVTANFSVPMDALTITSAYTLKQGINPVAGAVSYSGSTASFNPTLDLLPSTLYTATITSGAKNVAGIALAVNYEWSFTTAATLLVAPAVISTEPMDNAIDVALNQLIKATFDVPMNSSTISSSSFTLKKGMNSVDGDVTYIGSTASFNPTNDLLPGTTYTATITIGAENEAGTPLDVDYTWEFTTAGDAVVFPLIVNLNSAGNFVVLAGSGISNIGTDTRISGDVGSFPSATINGLLALNVINGGTLYTTADPIVEQAKIDLTTAYNDAQSRSLNAISLPGQLGGLTLTPGLYVNSSTSGISGTGPNGILTLDAGGDPNAVWIFKMGSTLVTDAGTSIVLAGNAQAKNIYWSVGSSATLGTNSVFYGNILADQSITLTTGATLTGRALTRIGAITLESNIITKP